MGETANQEVRRPLGSRQLKKTASSSRTNNSGKWKSALRRYRHVWALLAIVLGVFLIGYYFYGFVIQGASQSPACIIQSRQASEILPDLHKGDVVSQQFEADGRAITGFALEFATYQRVNGGTLHFTLTDVETEEILYEQRIAAAGLADNQYYQVIFENAPVSCEAGQKLSINVYVEDLAPDATLTLYRTGGDGYYQGVAVRNGRVEEKFDLAFRVYSGQNAYLRIVYWMFIGGVLALCLFSYFFLFMWKKKGKKELVAAIAIFFFSVTYSVILPPRTVPDEPDHFSTAYHYSNVLMGTDQYDSFDDGYVGMRPSDIEFIGLNVAPDIAVYNTVKDNLFQKVDSNDVVLNSANIVPAPQFLYAFSALGITLGRLLHLGLVPVYYLARLFNLIVFSVAAYFAMKLMPFGKMAIFAVSMLPITLQQTGSVSYDVIINAIAFLLIGYVFYLAYGEPKRVRIIDMILVCVLSIMLTMCKTGAYLPICMLVFIIPASRFVSRKIAYAFKGVTAVSGFLGVAAYLVLKGIFFVNSDPSPYLRWTTTPKLAYTIGDLLRDPIHTIRLFVRTFAYQKDFYTETALGHLSWFSIKMSPFLMIVFVVWALMTGLRPQNELQKMSGISKFWVGLMAVGSMGIVMLGMTIGWTPNDYEIIQGVQGRYFLPFLPMALLMTRTSAITVRRNIDGSLIFFGLWLELLTVLDFVRIILQGVYIP